MTEKDILLKFLRYPLDATEGIFDKFLSIPGARSFGYGNERSLYITGSRPKKVILIAHADTYWDADNPCIGNTELVIDGERIYNPQGGLGADDRAGCALVWILKDLGHSILITSGEEKGSCAIKWLIDQQPDVIDEINDTHQFMVQFDRGNGRDYKCYDVGTDAFRTYIEQVSGYQEPDRERSTDIKYLCKRICGVNLSIGYHQEHTKEEYLMFDEWQHTLEMAKKWLKESNLPVFKLEIE
jgi:hypothetical protein